jgi:predicted Na+-dependent transporter
MGLNLLASGELAADAIPVEGDQIVKDGVTLDGLFNKYGLIKNPSIAGIAKFSKADAITALQCIGRQATAFATIIAKDQYAYEDAQEVLTSLET